MRFYKLVIGLLTSLLILRLFLPYIIIHYVEQQINKIPEYRVNINDLDVHLYRGSYTIKKLELRKVTKNIPVPFFTADKIDLSLEWGALLHGSVVAKVISEHPVINFVIDPKGKNEQLKLDDQWITIVKSLFPLNFNKVIIHHGEIYYQSFSGKSPFKVYLKDVEFQIENMQNVRHAKALLPSKFKFAGKTMKTGSLSLQGKFNPYSKRPTFYINISLLSLPMNQLKAFLKHYTNVDVKSGMLSVYSEVATADEEVKGYFKPFIKDLEIAPTKKSTAMETLYDDAASAVASLLKNSKKKTIATQIDIHGKIDDPNMSMSSILKYTLRHAFIQALLPRIDNSIKMNDLLPHSMNSSYTSKKNKTFHKA